MRLIQTYEGSQHQKQVDGLFEQHSRSQWMITCLFTAYCVVNEAQSNGELTKKRVCVCVERERGREREREGEREGGRGREQKTL